jgi:hypothetical protein
MFRHADALFALISAGFFFTSLMFATLWVRARERAARAESFLDGFRMMSGREAATNPALDAIAEEVERIGEGQRFLTRVMSEQASRASLPPQRAPGSITPH